MKAHLTIILAIILFICLQPLRGGAQFNPVFGIKAGPNFRTGFISGSGKGSETSGSIIGFQLGGVMELSLNDQTDFRTGLSIISKGLKIKDFGDYDLYSPLYIEIPVQFLFHVSEYRIGGGPYLAIATGGRYKDNFGSKEDLLIGHDYYDDWAPFDFGLNLTASRDAGPMQVGAEFEIGIADTQPKDYATSEDYHTHNFNINLFAIYLFEE